MDQARGEKRWSPVLLPSPAVHGRVCQQCSGGTTAGQGSGRDVGNRHRTNTVPVPRQQHQRQRMLRVLQGSGWSGRSRRETLAEGIPSSGKSPKGPSISCTGWQSSPSACRTLLCPAQGAPDTGDSQSNDSERVSYQYLSSPGSSSIPPFLRCPRSL